MEPVRSRLNGPMVGNGDVASFEVSPDGARVAYLADEDVDGVNEIFVNADRGRRQHKSERDGSSRRGRRGISHSVRTRNGFCFIGDLATDGWRDLYSTPADGSQSTPNVLAEQIQGGTSDTGHRGGAFIACDFRRHPGSVPVGLREMHRPSEF